ncbi:MAG: PEP-CTERM sorting domain-containing protein [Verrucomicrobiota bacterium]
MKTGTTSFLSGIVLAGIITVRLPAAEINGSLTTGQNLNVNLSALGTEDWALWGYGSGGTSTSLAPDVTKAGGSGISSLTYLNPHSQPLRGLGQFHINFGFSWTDGNTVASASGAWGGLQSNDAAGPGLGVGEGFSFTVPADTFERILNVYVDEHLGVGKLTATLSDGSAPAYVNSAIPIGANSPGVYTIDYSAASPGQTLTVSWVETSYSATYDNPAIYAVTLSAVPEPGATTLMVLAGLTAGGFFLSRRKGIIATLLAVIAVQIPVGYQDETGFHVGMKKQPELSDSKLE